MRRKAAGPDLCAPILMVVVIMFVLFGVVQRVARHIENTSRDPSVQLLRK